MSDESTTPGRTVRPRRPRGLAEKLGSVVLGFEAVVVMLGGLSMFGLKQVPEGIEPWWAIVGGAVVATLMIVVAGMLARPAGRILGWALQGVVALSALLAPALLVIVAVFGSMWAYAMIAGGRVDRAARAASAAPSGEDSAPRTGTE